MLIIKLSSLFSLDNKTLRNGANPVPGPTIIKGILWKYIKYIFYKSYTNAFFIGGAFEGFAKHGRSVSDGNYELNQTSVCLIVEVRPIINLISTINMNKHQTYVKYLYALGSICF